MIDTPFDDLAIMLTEAGMRRSGKKDEKLLHSITFLQVCRVKYLQMYSISNLFWQRHKERFSKDLGTSSTFAITTKEAIDNSLESIEANANYFAFLEELNRFGRVFHEKYDTTLPKYFRIRFYRNKMVEHWDDYEEYLNKGVGFTYTVDKLIIPRHFGAMNIPADTDAAYSELSLEFKAFKITLPPLDLSMTADDKYSEELYYNLEKIDPELGRKIPNSLVNKLIKYTFPVPIKDLEEYFLILNSWLDTFLVEYKT
ncbi:MAG: hypothetical protein A3J48_02375 [Candidatus Doudnabacteria bacterium RIFCSPHIGHO2_02_FULL_46_11]|uniref:Uncharacterized protein n=1 Tax=Candidatus Doudnabacteria bacterium RIFCSPHIGHO2_02_FULL_46_11 TaxID=1817832 RepID=A0A1F5P9H5_9BACT|nr:MAG: hypothetical protein A3J48_02375 [Candidatus Doudnabacteria bacterium RIFCSPHIGHO2_02_FULL_46_11]